MSQQWDLVSQSHSLFDECELKVKVDKNRLDTYDTDIQLWE